MAAVSSQSEVNGVDMTDIEALTNISHMLRTLLPFASPPEVAQLAFALWVLGSTTLLLALTTLFHLPPGGPVFGRCAAAYYTILGMVLLIAVPVELLTALCLRLRLHSREGRLLTFASYYLLPCAHRGHSFHVVSIDVLPKQLSVCQVGFPQYGFSHTVVQILRLLDVLANEALRQGLKEYSSWPTFLEYYIDGVSRNIKMQILWSLDETLDVLANEALHQGLKRYSCWPTLLQLYIDGNGVASCAGFSGQQQLHPGCPPCPEPLVHPPASRSTYSVDKLAIFDPGTAWPYIAAAIWGQH